MESIITSLKKNSRKTYRSHFAQYIKWAQKRMIEPFSFPLSYVHVSAFLVDKIGEGKIPSTIRGYISAFKWFNDMSGFQGKNGEGWNTNFFLFKRLKTSAKQQLKKLTKLGTGAIPLTQNHLKWIYKTLCTGTDFNNKMKGLAFLFGTAMGLRASSVLKTNSTTKGLRFGDVCICYKTDEKRLRKVWDLYPPAKLYHLITGLQFVIKDLKTSSVNEYDVRFVGRTYRKKTDPVMDFILMINAAKFKLMHHQDKGNFLFRNVDDKPISVAAFQYWINGWRGKLEHYSDDLYVRVTTHSMRKSFCNVLYKMGWDMVQIGAYGGWKVPTAISCYYLCYRKKYFEIMMTLLMGTPKSNVWCTVLDLDIVDFTK